MFKKCFASGAAVLGAMMWAGGPAQAAMYGFYNITGNSAVDAAIGEAQLQVEVTDPGGNQVKFTFTNSGPGASSIADVYFDDSNNDSDPLASLASITNGPGVSFSAGASPPNLPAGNSISPAFSSNFNADSDAPVAPNGVNPGETLALTFNLANGMTVGDVIDELDAGTLRIGLHVQAFADGNSESFINVKPVPTPGACLLGLTGLGLFIRMRRHWSDGNS